MRLAGIVLGVTWIGCGCGASPSVTTRVDAGAPEVGTPETGTPATDSGAADVSPDTIEASLGAGGGPPPPCSEPPMERPDGGTCILEAKGEVTDLTDNPLPGLVMTFCGAECFGTKSDKSGNYLISVGIFLDTQNFAIHADGRPDHAVDYLRLPGGEPKIITATMHLPTLPPSTVVLPPDGAPASSVSEGDLTLVIAAGTKFILDVEDYGTTAGRTLRVASVPLASAPAYAAAATVSAIYALAPSGATSSVKMGVTLKNSAALAALAAVDIMVLGDDYFSVPPDVGTLTVVAAAHVSADGTMIQTDPGEGITKITWLAVRPKGG